MYPEDVRMMDKTKRCFKCPTRQTCGNPFNSFLKAHKPFIAQNLFEPDYYMHDLFASG